MYFVFERKSIVGKKKIGKLLLHALQLYKLFVP